MRAHSGIFNTKVISPILPLAQQGISRQGDVFFIGARSPLQMTIEAIFESDCRCPVKLFAFTFASQDEFTRGEQLVRSIKKNFKGFVVGQFLSIPSPGLFEHAYATGIDIVNVPFTHEKTKRLEALVFARSIFPRWAVTSTVFADGQSLSASLGEIDLLLDHGILPMVTVRHLRIAPESTTIGELFEYLFHAWQDKNASITPLQALLTLKTPFFPPSKKGRIQGLFDKVNEARLQTTSDLRRLLRVREIRESFESAGL